jgi:hypothetical protein
MSSRPTPDIDASMVIGMASTAIPFARSRADQAERWLRILRMHGESGIALHELGVSEGPANAEHARQQGGAPNEGVEAEQNMVAQVSECAARAAEARGARDIRTRDVLVAVMEVYGDDFDHVLSVHGTERAEVLERLSLQEA